MLDIASYDQVKTSQNSLNRVVHVSISWDEQSTPIKTYSTTPRFWEMLMGMVFEMLAKFPSNKTS